MFLLSLFHFRTPCISAVNLLARTLLYQLRTADRPSQQEDFRMVFPQQYHCPDLHRPDRTHIRKHYKHIFSKKPPGK